MLFQGLIQRNVICFFFCFPSLCLFFVCYACHSSVLFLRLRTSNSSQPISQCRERGEERGKKNQCCWPIHLLIFSDSLFVPWCREAASDLQMNCLLMCVLHFVVKNFLRGNSSQNSTSTKYSVGSVSITQSTTIGEHKRHKV